MSQHPAYSKPPRKKKKRGCGCFLGVLLLLIGIGAAVYGGSILKELNVVDFTGDDSRLGIAEPEDEVKKATSATTASSTSPFSASTSGKGKRPSVPTQL